MSGTRQRLMDAVRTASETIQRCRDAPVSQAKETFGDGMVQIIRARNDRLRELPGDAPARDGELRRLNAILSLMASIEFPLAGFHRERLDEVAQALHSLQEHSGA